MRYIRSKINYSQGMLIKKKNLIEMWPMLLGTTQRGYKIGIKGSTKGQLLRVNNVLVGT